MSEEEGRELSRELSNTYVALSEIYMTDLCDNEEAETESRRYIQVHTTKLLIVRYLLNLRVGRRLVSNKPTTHITVVTTVLWSRSRPEPDFFAGAGEKAPFCCCVA